MSFSACLSMWVCVWCVLKLSRYNLYTNTMCFVSVCTSEPQSEEFMQKNP